MLGLTGHRMVYRNVDSLVSAPQNLIKVQFPQKTTVTSAQLVDHFGRPTYRKDIRV